MSFVFKECVCLCLNVCVPLHKKQSTCAHVCEPLTHESASSVCVCGNSQRVETSRRSEWSFHISPALFQDFAPAPAPARAPAPPLVPLDTSHRLGPPLWAGQSPCGSWDTGRGIHSCHRPAECCCPTDRSLRGNLQETEVPDWVALAGSVPLWKRC